MSCGKPCIMAGELSSARAHIASGEIAPLFRHLGRNQFAYQINSHLWRKMASCFLLGLASILQSDFLL